MTQVYARARGFYYLVVVSPVLTPGVIIGISTVIFWKDVTHWTGTQSLFNGMLLATLGQSQFISAYCMLIFLSRLQRYDRVQEEAALDLGASRTQVFFDILLPFLRPAIFSAAVIAFLSSFENYNTTTFAILADKTLTTVLAGRVRQGLTPRSARWRPSSSASRSSAAMIYELVKRGSRRRRLNAPGSRGLRAFCGPHAHSCPAIPRGLVKQIQTRRAQERRRILLFQGSYA